MSKEPIHSGHFMTSNLHTDAPEDEDEDVEVDVVDVDEGCSVVPLDKSATKEKVLKDVEKPVTFYKFGPQKTQSIAIDVSLNKLNKCIRVAYMKMTTPKWKDFKGLKLQWKSRIRLNNVIWRAYYMEFRKPGRKRRAPYCYFSVPDEDTTHAKLEGAVMEGMYWKRRMEAVCAQYKRWRAYNSRKKRCCRKRENSCSCEMAPSILLQSKTANQIQPNNQMRSLTPENMISEQWNNASNYLDFEDDLDNEFTNQLFEQLNAPFHFPNPKEGGVQIGNADITQPTLLSLQPYIEEMYPFGPEDLVEFANSMPPLSGETSGQPTPQQQQQYTPTTPQQSMGKMMPSPPPIQSQIQQQYTEKEYDAANMLVDYSNRAVHQQQLASSTKSTGPIPRQQQQIVASTQSQPAMPVPVVTPNVSNPLYSQAAVYEPQRLVTIGQQQFGQNVITTTSLVEAPIVSGYGRDVAPPMSTKIANQTVTQHTTITSMASSPHPAHFLHSAIDYSLLIAASSSAVALSQAVGQATLAGPSRPQQVPNQQWPWFIQQQQQNSAQQQQQVYSQLPQQQQQNGNMIRKTSNGIQQQPMPQAQTFPSAQISPLTLSTNNFSAQSLLAASNQNQSPLASHLPPYASPALTNLISPQQNSSGGIRSSQQSALTAHLQQKPQQQSQSQQQHNSLLHSLASSANPQTPVRQFVMSDLSRYLTQQSPIGVNTNGPQPQQQHHPLIPANLNLNNSNNTASNLGGNLSPIGSLHYSPATTPMSAPIFGQQNKQTSNQQQQIAHQKQQIQQQQQLHSQHSSMDLTFASPPPPKKSSTSALPSEFQLSHVPPAKKGRASFSAAQRPHLGKRQIKQQQMELQQQQQFGERMDTGEGPPVASFFGTKTAEVSQFGSPTKNNRQWSSGRRKTSESIKQTQIHQQQLLPLTPPPAAQLLPAPQLVPRRKGQSISVCEANRRMEQPQTSSTIIETTSEENLTEEGGASTPGTLISQRMQNQLIVKEEESIDEKPLAMLLAPMSHKRRHQSSSSSSFAAGTTGSGVSSSHSAAADSTVHPEERKRILHLNAEKNRRSALKEGFECLVNAIPMVEQAGVKSTNAVVLNRAAQHIRGLVDEREEKQRQIKAFREKITNMNERIALIQSNLPSSSLSGSKAGDSSSPTMRIQVEQFFERYKKDRSREDYRFWLMGEVLKPLMNSFAEQVHPDSGDRERVALSARKWLDTHWNSAVLRPITSDVLVRIATASGGAFTNEKSLSNYIAQQVNQHDNAPGASKH